MRERRLSCSLLPRGTSNLPVLTPATPFVAAAPACRWALFPYLVAGLVVCACAPSLGAFSGRGEESVVCDFLAGDRSWALLDTRFVLLEEALILSSLLI